MQMIYDVAVIGAGPAGAVFASQLARGNENLSILLIDGQTEKNPKVCGGLLGPDAQKVLAKLGMDLPKSVLEDPQIFSVETLDLASRDIRLYQKHYLNMDRLSYDRWLLSFAPDNVDIINARCTAIEKENERYKLALSGDGYKNVVLACSVVGADGASSIVRRTFFGKGIKKYVSIQEWYPYNEAYPSYACIFDPKTSDSCSWVIRKKDFTIFGGAFDKRGCRVAFEAQKARYEKYIGEKLGEPIRIEACLVSSPRRWRDFIVGKGRVYLIGEAAGFISASSYEGISSALYSAKLLADAFLQAKGSDRVLKLYKKKTVKLRLKLYSKIWKMRILFCPLLRRIIMRSGVQSLKKYDKQVSRERNKASVS